MQKDVVAAQNQQVQLTRPNSWTEKICHGLLNMGMAHLAEVMEVTVVGAWQNTWGDPIYA